MSKRKDPELQAIKDELTVDPLARGYASMSDVEASESFNTPDRSPDVTAVDAARIVQVVTPADIRGLKDEEVKYLDWLIAAGSTPLTDSVRAVLVDILPDVPLTRPGTRGEEFGLGRVTPSDIADAKRFEP